MDIFYPDYSRVSDDCNYENVRINTLLNLSVFTRRTISYDNEPRRTEREIDKSPPLHSINMLRDNNCLVLLGLDLSKF